MANVTITPNMNLPAPVPTVDPGPDYATNNTACLFAIDSHNHSSGQGVQINPSGLSINSDLPVNSNNVTLTRSVRFASQLVALSDPADIGCIYEVGVDLYYNDGAGNQVRITQGGSVTGSAGTITGLPSGTASASFAASTFTFEGATSTPANLSVGPITIGTNTASPKTVTIAPSGSQAANYNLTLPTALPGSTAVLTLDASGNIATSGVTGSGTVVLSSGPSISNPTLTGTVSGGATYNTPTIAGPVITSPNITGVVTGSPAFTGTPDFTAGMFNAGGGTAASQLFKIAIYTSTIAGTTTASITAPSSIIVGVFGFWLNTNTGSNGAMGTFTGSGTPTQGVVFGTNATANIVTFRNYDSSSATYRIVVFYQ